MGADGNFPQKRRLDLSIIESLFFKPRLEDPEQQRIARIIHSLSTLVLLIGFCSLILSPFIFDSFLIGYPITASFLVVMFAVQLLNRKGKVRAAAHLFVYFIWIVDTAIIILNKGFFSEYLPAYIAITVMGGLILGGMAAIHFAGLSVFALLVLFFLDSMGLMPAPLINFNPLALFVIFTVNIFMAALVLMLVTNKYEETFSQLIEKEQSLHRTNLELKWEIEAREQAEVFYKQSEDRYKSALLNSPYPTMLHAEDGEILFINNTWKEKSGYRQTEFSTVNDLHNHLFRERAYQAVEKTRELITGKQELTEGYFPIFTKGGETKNWYFRWTLLPELPDGRNIILTSAVDITNLVDAEAALRKSEENLSRLALVTNDGLWDWDLATDQVNFDPRYYTMAGYEVDEFPHHLDEFRKRVHPDDVDRVFSQAQGHLSGQESHFAVEFRFLTKDGSWLWILGRGKIVEQDQDGNPLRFVGTHTDISDRKRAEEQLKQYRVQLEEIVEDRTQKLADRIQEVEKLNAALSNILDDYQIANEKLSRVSSRLANTNQELESLTYVVSEDLRKPLQAIRGLSESLAAAAGDRIKPADQERISQISAQAIQMESMISNLLSLTELSHSDLVVETIDTRQLVDDVLLGFAGQIQDRDIKLTIQDLPHCQADYQQLKIVLDNLVSNAIKFTLHKKKPEITIGSQPGVADEKVTFFIKDNGVGFSRKDQGKVFEVFQRLHDQDEFRGAGIGLALARKIIENHQGEIWAEGKKNRGATFYFDLNRSRQPGQ